MKTRGEILRAHYIGLLQRNATWATLVALLSMTLLPLGVNAATGQLVNRTGTMSDSAANASGVTVTFKYKPSVTNSGATIKGEKFELCNSPLESVTCVSPAGATMASVTAGVQSSTGTYANQLGSPAYTSTTAVTFNNATGNAPVSGDTITFPVAAVHLPTAANAEFYFRITTYNSNVTFNGTTEVDFGAMAEDTTNQLAVQAAIQEDITFCVGNGGTNCSNLTYTGPIALAPNPMLSSAASSGTGLMYASTNAASGYSIAYNGTAFQDTTGDTIGSGTQALATSTIGTDQFGFTLKNTAPSGYTTGLTEATNYNTANSYSYKVGTAEPVATETGTSTGTLFTMSYNANVAAADHPGIYTANQTFIATGIF